MTDLTPHLAGISHGTSSPSGQAAVAALMAAVGEARPDLDVSAGFVDVQQPDARATIDGPESGIPVVVVPLLLSAGYHVHVDLTEAVGETEGRTVQLAAALGPDVRLARVLAARLAEAGLRADDSLVLAVAGSSDSRAVEDCRVMARLLETATGLEVTLGFLSAAHPRLPVAVAAARAANTDSRVVVSSYLLAPGYFQNLAVAGGGDITTEPLLTPSSTPAPLIELVVDRYVDAAALVGRTADAAQPAR